MLIAGDGWMREGLQRQIDALGLGEVVTLLGMRADVPDLLAAADVAVCCSDFEGGPLSVMEYMGAGLPVLATEVGGLPELISDGENGILIPPRDPGALAEAAAALLADPERRPTAGRGRQGASRFRVRGRRLHRPPGRPIRAATCGPLAGAPARAGPERRRRADSRRGRRRPRKRAEVLKRKTRGVSG